MKPVGIFGIIYQNVQISGEKGDLFHFIGCLLARVIRSKLISVQFDHPVVSALVFHPHLVSVVVTNLVYVSKSWKLTNTKKMFCKLYNVLAQEASQISNDIQYRNRLKFDAQ